MGTNPRPSAHEFAGACCGKTYDGTVGAYRMRAHLLAAHPALRLHSEERLHRKPNKPWPWAAPKPNARQLAEVARRLTAGEYEWPT